MEILAHGKVARGGPGLGRARPEVVHEAKGVGPASNDGFDPAALGPAHSASGKSKAAVVTGPYASLAKRGDFSGTVLTASGEIFVSVRVAKTKPGTERPMVYLAGLAATRDRSEPLADKLRDDGGKTIIAILLEGQGETLLRDLEKHGGQSISNDISDTEQVKVVLEVLDALGVHAPVDILGLSYGGAIAAATKREAPDRIRETLLVAPHVRSQAKELMGVAAWQLANSPWNPFGHSMYRTAAKATLAKAFGGLELFKDHPGAFSEALFRLSMGIDKNELADVTQGMENLHILVAGKDRASPLVHNQAAIDAADGGSLTVAPEAVEDEHDLVGESPELVVRWVTERLNPERLEKLPPADT